MSDSAAGRPEIVTTESGERGEWWEDAWRESQRTGTAFEPCNADIGIADADYVLRWLKQTNAPVNVIELQERAIRILIATEAKRAVLDARP